MIETNALAGSEWSPLKTVLSMAIGAALGTSVYVIAEVRHTREQAEKAPQLMPLLAAEQTELVNARPTTPARDGTAPQAAKLPPAAPVEAEEPTRVAPEDPKARALAERTTAEQALLDEARTQLAAKNAAAAQATLDRMKKRFARGALAQERELLRIEVYKARGQLPAAKRAARKFVKAYPDSPHIDELDGLTGI